MKAYMLRYNYIILIVLTGFLAGCGNKKQADTTQSGRNSAVNAEDSLAGSKVAAGGSSSANTKPVKNILFFGTSLTAGLGVDPDQAYPAVIQHKIDSLRLTYKVINAGLSGETSAAGKSRINWLLRQPVDVFVLEMGANDGLRGIPVKETTANLQSVIDQVKKKYPKAKLVLAGMQMPPSMGEKYTTDFKNIFPVLAKKNGMDFVPFLLQGVAGIPDLNQQDGIHPTPKGHKILAENVWQILGPDLKD